MHVLVATDGNTDAKKTAEIAGKLAGSDGSVTVFTVIEVPRQMLNEMRAAASDPAESKQIEQGVEFRTTQAGDPAVTHWVGDDAVITRYVNSKIKGCTGDLATELEAAGVEFTVVAEEGENAARSVLDAVRSRDVDILCVGTHGGGRFEGLLGSLSTKMARLAPCSVVLVR